MTFLRLLAAALLLFGQVAFAAGGAVPAGAATYGDEIVICTPTGLKIIRLSDDGTPVEPTTIEGVICPSCLMADLSLPTSAPTTITRIAQRMPAKYAHAVSALKTPHVDLPYLTRAPPV